MLEVDGLDVFCGRVHLQTMEIKGNQGKSREIKGNQRNPRGAKGNQGESMESRENQVTQGEGNPR